MTTYNVAQIFLGLNLILNMIGSVAIWRIARGVPGLGWWALGSVVIFAGTLSSIAAALLHVPVLQTGENVAAVSAFLIAATGVRAFYGRRVRVWPLVAFAVVYAAVDLHFRIIAESTYIRFVMLSLLEGAGAAVVVAHLLALERRRSVAWALPAALMTLAAATFGGRGIYALADMGPGTPFTVDHPLVIVPAIVGSFCATGAFLGFILMTSNRLVDERTAREQEAAALADKFRMLATYDALTGVRNRRSFLDRIAEEADRCRRDGAPLCLLAIDLDHFKKINDTFGHAAGDLALVQATKSIQAELRAYDACGRMGGEEFAVMLAGLDIERAALVAERVRAAIERNGFLWEGARRAMTASVGVAQMAGDGALGRLFERADRALYAAKARGRNRVILDSDRFAAPAGI